MPENENVMFKISVISLSEVDQGLWWRQDNNRNMRTTETDESVPELHISLS